MAYQEAVSLKRQEELIREEEAAWLAENEKAKRGTGEKDKKSKKRQVAYSYSRFYSVDFDSLKLTHFSNSGKSGDIKLNINCG